MSPTKVSFDAEVAQPCDNESQRNVSETKGTANDQKDMLRMGKQQELRRNFGLLSIFGYSMILMATWENTLTCVLILHLLHMLPSLTHLKELSSSH
jgi:choline transport protein